MACVILLFVLRRFRASLQEFASLGTCGLVIFNKLFLLLYSFTKMACVILLLVLRWFRASLQEFACLGMCGLVIFNKLKRKKKKKKKMVGVAGHPILAMGWLKPPPMVS
jgi:chromate transport protein ChrA